MKDYAHGGNLRQAQEDFGIPWNKFIDFSSNVYPALTKIKNLLSGYTGLISSYPDTQQKDLTGAIAGLFNIAHKNILVGNGSIELIYLILHLLKPKKAVISVPTFTEYERASKAGGLHIDFIKLRESKNFNLDIGKILQCISRRTAVFICNPNNPTGNLTSKTDILTILYKCIKMDSFLILDEAFMEFVQNSKNFTLVSAVKHYKNLFILRSFTKLYGLAGIRLGFAVSSNKNIALLRNIQYPWSVNVIAEKLGQVVIKNKDIFDKQVEFIYKERESFFLKLKGIKGLHPYPPTANFIFCKLGKIDSTSLYKKLARSGILIRDCSNFRGLDNKFIRIAVKKTDENDKLITILRQCL